jgi:hypothetical protein
MIHVEEFVRTRFMWVFTKRKEKKRKENNNKILSVTSACCGAVTRNECRDHFSLVYKGSSLK